MPTKTLVLVAAVMAALTAVPTPSAANVPLAPSVSVYSGINGPSSIAAADLNRDGHTDLVVASIELDRVSVLFGGPSPAVVVLTTSFDQACFVRAADIDGDSWLDVVGSERGSDGVQARWWRNPGEGGGSWSEHGIHSGAPYDFSQARSVATGDLDGDGDADVVVAGMSDTISYISWYENIGGDGTSWVMRDVTTWFASYFGGPHDAVIVDVNGDGRLDVAAVAYDEDEVAWFENDGTIHDGDTWAEHTIETGFDGAVCVAAADMDADGDPDIIAGAYLDGDVAWFENRLDQGLSWDSHGLDYGLGGVYTVQPVDLDYDGDLDVLAAGRETDAVRWYERVGSTTFALHDVDAAFDGARSAVATDYDDDGDLDVVAAGEFADRVAWWENRLIHHHATFESREVVEDLSLQPTAVEVADLDQDGDLDVVGTVYNTSSAVDVVMWSREIGGWAANPVGGFLDGASGLRVADIDADGHLDVVAAGMVGHAVVWYEGDGSGAYWRNLVATGVSGAKDVETADFDCDGDLDIAVVAAISGEVLWFENDDGAGGSWTPHTIITLDYPSAVRVADFNLDGNPDLVVTDENTGLIWAMLHLDCGTVWAQLVVGTVLAGPKDVDVADFNRDGWPDVVAAAGAADTVAVFLRDSSDWVWNQHDVATGFDAWGVTVADVNRDGDPDIVAAGRADGDVRWWRNLNGGGTSWGAGGLLDTALSGARAVASGDLDEDGFADVVAASTEGNLVTLYESNGGQYIVWTQDLAPAQLDDSDAAPILGIIPLHAGTTGDIDMELRNIGLKLEDGAGNPLTTAQANALILAFHVWFDADGNGEIDAGTDDLLAIADDFTLTASGYTTVAVPHGGTNPRIALTDLRRYILAVTTTADASAQVPNQFRISHRNTSPVLARYYDYPGIPLRPVWWAPFYAKTVTCSDPSGLIFADGFESSDTGGWDQTGP